MTDVFGLVGAVCILRRWVEAWLLMGVLYTL